MASGDRSPEEARIETLLDEALRRPGVREVIDVYRRWQVAETVAAMHRQVVAVQKVVFASDSSTGWERY